MQALEARSQKAMKKSVTKRKRRKTGIRTKYMEARRQATSERQIEKKNLVAVMNSKIKKVPRNQRAALRKKLKMDIKRRWALFKQKFPHSKKVKTDEALRRLTETVKHHRLRA